MKQPLLLSTLIVLFAQLPSFAQTTIYVNSSTGNDVSGTGANAAPYKTFNKAYTTAASGDTIDLSGTFGWTDASETGDAGITGYTLAKNITVRANASSSAIQRILFCHCSGGHSSQYGRQKSIYHFFGLYRLHAQSYHTLRLC
jgi:hypothetical protein